MSRNTICCIASSATYCFNGYEMRAAAPCSAAHRSRELGRVEPCVTPFEAPVHMRSRRTPGPPHRAEPLALDRKSVVSGKSVSVRVDLGGGRSLKKKKNKDTKE